jgi:hypothetical protein
MTDENKFHTTTSKWSESIENILKEMGEFCLGYKWMNVSAAKNNELKYNILMYISILIGPISGILSAISTDKNAIYLSAIQMLVTVFSFLSGVISATIKFSEFGDKSTSYKTAAAKYASLESNIRRQLSLSREDRVNAGEYLEWVSTSYDELFTASPLIPDNIYQEWVNFAKENNLSIPKELGKVVADNNADKIAQLSSIGNIDIYREKKEPDKPAIEIAVQTPQANLDTDIGHVERLRTAVDGSAIDLAKYSDGKMRYEMARLFRMK